MVYYPQVFFGVGSQVIYFDSHPEEQEGLLYSIYSHFKTALHGAWTGDVEKPLLPGSLRLVYFTTDNEKGFRDYELHQYARVRADWETLRTIPEVRRCYVTGFSGQNPYVWSASGSKIWTEQEKIVQSELRKQARRAKARAETPGETHVQEKSVLEHIDEAIQGIEAEEREALNAFAKDKGEEAV
ncbi:hypothetical protein LTS18_007719 [Coniosporium uncinatum]|uniref:Uncharacterized protein n=1 Tax=Coniosporium uncinatum TaxID=93489 RepID=A0ACC3DAF2_9PEZI|nr:hypothetical protein LTS18_007719 [Coniosporium uncinatum]